MISPQEEGLIKKEYYHFILVLFSSTVLLLQLGLKDELKISHYLILGL